MKNKIELSCKAFAEHITYSLTLNGVKKRFIMSAGTTILEMSHNTFAGFLELGIKNVSRYISDEEKFKEAKDKTEFTFGFMNKKPML